MMLCHKRDKRDDRTLWSELPFRMLDYRVRGYRRYPQKTMRQILIYLRSSSSPLVYQNQFELENTSHRFEVIRLWEQPTETFLATPGLLPFAALSRTEDPVKWTTECPPNYAIRPRDPRFLW